MASMSTTATGPSSNNTTTTKLIQRLSSSEETVSKKTSTITAKKRKLIQTVPELIQDLCRSSLRCQQGLISLRMVNHNELDSWDVVTHHNGHVHHSSGQLVTRIEESFQHFDTFLRNHWQDDHFSSYLNGLQFTIFIKSFVTMFDLGHRNEAKKFYHKFCGNFKPASTNNDLNGSTIKTKSNTKSMERQKSLLDSMETSLGINLLDSSLVNFVKTKIFIPLPSCVKQQLSNYLTSVNDMILNRFINETMILVEIQRKEAKDPKDEKQAKEVSSVSSKRSSAPNLLPLSIKSEPKDEEEIQKIQKLTETIDCFRQSSTPCLWSLCLCTFKTSSTSNRVCCATIKDDNSMIVTGFESNQIQVVPFKSRSVKKKQSDLTLDMESSPLFECINEGSDDGDSGYEWPTLNDNILRGHNSSITSIKFIPRSDLLLSTSKDGTTRCWNVSTMSNVSIYSTGNLNNQPIWCLDVSPLDGLYFGTGSSDTMVKLWSPEYNYPLRLFAGHNSHVNCLKFHPNCKYLASGSSDSCIKMWSLNDAKCVRSFTTNTSSGNNLTSSAINKSCLTSNCCSIVTTIDFSPNGHQLVSGGNDGLIRVWDLRTSKLLECLKGHKDVINHVTFNFNGNLLSSTSIDSTVKLWSMNNQEQQSVNQSCNEDVMTSSSSSTTLSSFNVSKTSSLLSSKFITTNSNLLITFASSSPSLSSSSSAAVGGRKVTSSVPTKTS